MSALNDARFDALRDQGLEGTTNDMLLRWLQLAGATSFALADCWLEVLTSLGFTGHRNDAWYDFLGSLGHEGAINDRELEFWLGGGVLPLPESCHELIAGTDLNNVGFQVSVFGELNPEESQLYGFTILQVYDSVSGNFFLFVTPAPPDGLSDFDYIEIDGVSVARAEDALYGSGEWFWNAGNNTADLVDGVTYEVCLKNDAAWNDTFIWNDNDVWDDNQGPQ